MLRLDKLHPEISGNKWFKLKYNLEEAKHQKKETILTFGGAFSNHIAATAYACKLHGFKSIGIIRGEASSIGNPTLSFAESNGMQLVFETRENYKQKSLPVYLNNLEVKFPNAYVIPEGGDNDFGEKGCAEILTEETVSFTNLFCAYGTSTTFKGMYHSLKEQQFLTGVNVLNYEAITNKQQAAILNQYHFGGYAKHTLELLKFKTWFEDRFNIELDYVYTTKVCFAVFDQIKQGILQKSDKILIIHTGGLQGNKGYEERYNLNPSRHVKDAQG